MVVLKPFWMETTIQNGFITVKAMFDLLDRPWIDWIPFGELLGSGPSTNHGSLIPIFVPCSFYLWHYGFRGCWQKHTWFGCLNCWTSFFEGYLATCFILFLASCRSLPTPGAASGAFHVYHHGAHFREARPAWGPGDFWLILILG